MLSEMVSRDIMSCGSIQKAPSLKGTTCCAVLRAGLRLFESRSFSKGDAVCIDQARAPSRDARLIDPAEPTTRNHLVI